MLLGLVFVTLAARVKVIIATNMDLMLAISKTRTFHSPIKF